MSHLFPLSSSNSSTIFMLTFTDILLIGKQFGLCVECFLYGKISFLCDLTCTITVTIAKEVQLLHGPGVYSGIFAIYLKCPKKDSRIAMIVFYVLGLLYILSTATVVFDLLYIIFAIHSKVSNNSICNLNMFFYQLCRMHYRLSFKLTCCQYIFASILSNSQ